MERKMNREWLLKRLKELQEDHDTENAHILADRALLQYIGDSKIKKEFENIHKWYA